MSLIKIGVREQVINNLPKSCEAIFPSYKAKNADIAVVLACAELDSVSSIFNEVGRKKSK